MQTIVAALMQTARSLRAPGRAGGQPRWRHTVCGTVVALAAWPAAAPAAGWCERPELNVNGLSRHFYETERSRREGWREFNPGLGLTCHLRGVGRWSDEVEAGFFKNSHSVQSVYLGYGIYHPLGAAVSVGLRASVATGYRDESPRTGLAAGILPTAKFQLSDRVMLNVSLAPKRNSVLLANLGLEF